MVERGYVRQGREGVMDSRKKAGRGRARKASRDTEGGGEGGCP